MSVSVNIPEELYRQASEVAAAENIPIDELFASVFEERLLELERLKEKSARGTYEKFLKVMSKVPAVELATSPVHNVPSRFYGPSDLGNFGHCRAANPANTALAATHNQQLTAAEPGPIESHPHCQNS